MTKPATNTMSAHRSNCSVLRLVRIEVYDNKALVINIKLSKAMTSSSHCPPFGSSCINPITVMHTPTMVADTGKI